jgi:hypothetical protein
MVRLKSEAGDRNRPGSLHAPINGVIVISAERNVRRGSSFLALEVDLFVAPEPPVDERVRLDRADDGREAQERDVWQQR